MFSFLFSSKNKLSVCCLYYYSKSRKYIQCKHSRSAKINILCLLHASWYLPFAHPCVQYIGLIRWLEFFDLPVLIICVTYDGGLLNQVENEGNYSNSIISLLNKSYCIPILQVQYRIHKVLSWITTAISSHWMNLAKHPWKGKASCF